MTLARSHAVTASDDRAVSAEILSHWVADARRRSLALVHDLDDEQLMVPRLETINPLIWEIGHAAWFQEQWVLRHACGESPIFNDGEQLFDSITIPHEVRWDLPVPCRETMLDYVGQVRDRVLDVIQTRELANPLLYFIKLSVFHEDMHTEAFTYTRQTLSYPPPRFDQGAGDTAATADRREPAAAIPAGDAEVPAGVHWFGAAARDAFVFDNEKWAHPVEVRPYRIARACVTQREYAAFVDDGGYERSDWWSPEGWSWRSRARAQHPIYWRREPSGQWLVRAFDQWRPLDPDHPVIHVNWFEARAYAAWAGRRLPTEIEWERAATGPIGPDAPDDGKPHYPWGNSSPTPAHANTDWQRMGTAPVASHPLGDSPFGCRQMIGNVWEWTESTLEPFPEFVVDPYQEYSRGCFGGCKVLRGGCWATRARLLRTTWRNFYPPHRRDIWAGFRTCAK